MPIPLPDGGYLIASLLAGELMVARPNISEIQTSGLVTANVVQCYVVNCVLDF